MQKKIAKVNPAGFGHLMLEFEDGVKQLVHLGDHEAHAPKGGDLWPPDGHEHVIESPDNDGVEILRAGRRQRATFSRSHEKVYSSRYRP